jgi:NAD(P)-dependent dehydrogenase (short-subunit alcohol dehydrogenase family)
MGGAYLIIGGSSGIGLELTNSLASAGNTVFEGSRRDPDLNTFRGVTHFHFDVDDPSTLPESINSLDGLAYLPGTINLKPFHRLKKEDFISEFRTNVLGAVEVIQQALPLLRKGQNPSILMFSTVAVHQGMSFHASTASAKGAVEGLVKSLAAEFAPNIRVNAIAPSIVNTPLANRLLSTPDKIIAAANRHPLQAVGEPKEIASLASMLLTQSTWMTGQILHVDGGMSTVKSL